MPFKHKHVAVCRENDIRRLASSASAPEKSAAAAHSYRGAWVDVNKHSAAPRKEAALSVGSADLQLYSLDTPNGHKVHMCLEEIGVPYDAHTIRIGSRYQEQFTTGFVAVNPNGKIPALVDKSVVSSGEHVFESSSILLHLAERKGRLLPEDPHKRRQCLNWLFWQHGSMGPYVGQFGYFYKYSPEKIETAISRYATETLRLLDVLDRHLEGKDFMCSDEFTIADIAIFPWVRCIDIGYNAAAHLDVLSFQNVTRWMVRVCARDSTKRALRVCDGRPLDHVLRPTVWELGHYREPAKL